MSKPLSADEISSLLLVSNGHDGPVLWGARLCGDGYLQAASQRNGHWMLTAKGEAAVAEYVHGSTEDRAS